MFYLSKQLSLEWQLLLTPLHNTSIFFKERDLNFFFLPFAVASLGSFSRAICYKALDM